MALYLRNEYWELPEEMAATGINRLIRLVSLILILHAAR